MQQLQVAKAYKFAKKIPSPLSLYIPVKSFYSHIIAMHSVYTLQSTIPNAMDYEKSHA